MPDMKYTLKDSVFTFLFRQPENVLGQYVRFCQIADEQRVIYGRTQEAVAATIRQCTEEQVLAQFLASRQKEVRDIMVTLFSQEQAWEIHDYNARQEALRRGRQEGRKEGRKEGRQEGRQEGLESGIRTTVSLMKEMSFTRETAIRKLAEQFCLLPHVAEEKVSQYWAQ